MATFNSALVADLAPVIDPALAVILVEEVMEEEELAKAKKLRKATALVETKPKTVKVPKEKAVKVPKDKVVKEKALASHPLYLVAIVALKEQTGSSQQAIAKYLEDQYNTGLSPNFKNMLTIQLRNLTKSGKLVKVKYSYKLLDELKKHAKGVEAPIAPVVKKSAIASRVKSKSTEAIGTKFKAGGAKSTKADVKTSKVAKPKAVEKVSAPAMKKAKIVVSSAKKVAPAAKKAKAVASKKAAPTASAKKPVA